MLRGICFDLWDTLIADADGGGDARARARVRRLERALKDGGWPAPPEAIEDALQATVDSLVRIHQDNHDVDAAERIALFFRHLDPSLRPEHDLPERTRQAITSAIHDSAIYSPPALLAGAGDLLAGLRRRGLRLALVSNTGLSPGTTMRSLLDGLGIGVHFTAQVYSDEVGAWKPNPRMFDEAVFALGLPAADLLFVGDTPEADILGARSFGIGMTALVGNKQVAGVRADIELPGVHTLAECLIERGLLEPAG